METFSCISKRELYNIVVMQIKSMDLTTGSTTQLIQKVILYSLPLILVGCIEILFSTFDLIVIEGFEGELSAAAVGANAALNALFTNVFIGLSTGENVVIAKYYGENNKVKAERACYSGLILAAMAGILVMIAGYFLAPTLLRWQNVDSSYFDLAVKYLRTYFFALPFISIYNFGSAIFRGTGNSRMPLIFLTIAGVLHISLNYLFVGACSLSVEGTGLSSICSYFVASILVFVFLRKHRNFIDFQFQKIRLYPEETLEILKVGIPSGLQGMVFAVSNIILQSTVNTWGPRIVEVNADCESIENFCYTSMFSVAQGGAAFISANYGKGEGKNVRKLIFIAEGVCMGFGLLIGLSLLALYHPLILAYTGGKADEEFFVLCLERLSLLLPLYFLCGAMDTFTNFLRGLNRATIPMVISIFWTCGFRLIWNFFVYSPDPASVMHSTILLYACYPVSWICSLLSQFVYYMICRKRVSKEIEENRIRYLEESQVLPSA